MEKTKNAGFTLIEIMIVIAVIGILSMVLVPKAWAFKLQAKEAGLDADVRVIRAYLESKIELWSMKSIPVSNIQNTIALSYGAGRELTNPVSMETAPAPAAGADLAASPDRPVYIAGTFDGLDIGNASNQQYLKGTIVVAVKGNTNDAASSVESIHIYAHNHEGVVISETIVAADGTTVAGTPATVDVTGLTLNKTVLVLSPGDSETLTATITPADATNRNIAWSSDTPGVAGVNSDGLVTGISAGTAVITAETEDGGHQASCTVTVEDSLPAYPVWDSGQGYSGGSYIIYDGRVFYARFYANSGVVPGHVYPTEGDSPWQEVTDQWRPYNKYVAGDEVWYNGQKFRAWHDSYNIEPTVIYPFPPPDDSGPSPWREITDQWRPYNRYAGGDEVWHNGQKYQAKWYTYNEEPGVAGVWAAI